MFCPKCGGSKEESSLFCAKCGHDLKAPVAPQPETTSVQVSAPTAYAGFWKRVGANLIDGFILDGVSFTLLSFIPLDWIPVSEDADFGTAMLQIVAWFWLLLAVAFWPYSALMESSSKRATLGKMALGITVTDYEGKRISFAKATGRYFGEFLIYLTFGIGYLMVIWTAKKQCLHDILAGTIVVNEKRQSSQG